MIRRTITEDGLVADFYSDAALHRRKAIIMLGGSEGGKVWSRVRRPIELLVERGYAILSLAYWGMRGLPDTLEDIPLEYFERAFAWLAHRDDIVSNEVAILGGSKGAEAALLLASRYPQVKAVVAFSPSSVVWQGIPKNRFDLGKGAHSSWSYRGASIPSLPYPSAISKWALLTLRLLDIHQAALKNEERVAKAAIPVEAIQGAVLLISGDRDQMWPSTYMSEQIVSRLQANGFKHAYKHISFNTGHNGLIINRTCWKSIFEFLQQNWSEDAAAGQLKLAVSDWEIEGQ